MASTKRRIAIGFGASGWAAENSGRAERRSRGLSSAWRRVLRALHAFAPAHRIIANHVATTTHPRLQGSPLAPRISRRAYNPSENSGAKDDQQGKSARIVSTPLRHLAFGPPCEFDVLLRKNSSRRILPNSLRLRIIEIPERAGFHRGQHLGKRSILDGIVLALAGNAAEPGASSALT